MEPAGDGFPPSRGHGKTWDVAQGDFLRRPHRHDGVDLDRSAQRQHRNADRAARIGFEYGKFSFLELLDAQRSWLAAQSQALQTQANAYRALAEIESLLGQPLSELAQAAPLGEK